MLSLFVLLLMMPGVSGAQVWPQESPLALQYRRLIESYRTGEAATAVERLLELKHDTVVALVDRYATVGNRGFPSAPTLDSDFFRAASMLHADAAFHCWTLWRDDEATSHLNLAGRLVDASERPNTKPGSFRRRWYAATALVATGHLAAPDAVAYFEDAVKKMPDDVPLLTAAGWFCERLSNYAAVPGTTLRNQRVVRRRHLQAAERFLKAALDADPRAPEAALRLGRVEWSMGRLARARERLTALHARVGLEPFIAYLARLTLGDLHGREGDLREAERLYREAMTLDPVAQSARVALAQLLYAAGDSSAAADVIEPFLAPGTGRERNDPWSDYQLAYPAIGRMLLDGLRQEVQQ